MKLYAQEPAFTPVDHHFLSLLFVNICTDDIATHITPRSFVFSPFVDWYLLLPVFLKDKDPLLYVGNEVLEDYGAYAQSEEKREKLEDCNRVGQRWLRRREMVQLQEFQMHPHALNGMVVYWIKTEEVENPGSDAGRDAVSGFEAIKRNDKADKARQEGFIESGVILKQETKE